MPFDSALQNIQVIYPVLLALQLIHPRELSDFGCRFAAGKAHPRHASNTPDPHAAPQRERRSEPDSRTGSRFRKPRRGHPAAIIE